MVTHARAIGESAKCERREELKRIAEELIRRETLDRSELDRLLEAVPEFKPRAKVMPQRVKTHP